MTTKVVYEDDEVAEMFEDVLLADGFEAALIGMGTQFNRAVAIYDWDQCVDILVHRDQMSEEEAVEFMDFNVTGAWAGNNTPIFLRAYVKNVERIQ